MTRIYFDNTASTPVYSEVVDVMKETLEKAYGNPSSVHQNGREARVVIESARKTIASLLNTSPAEIFFTSGGTESNNTAIHGAIFDMGIKNFITSPIEHHAVLHTLEHYAHKGLVNLHLVELDNKGHIVIDSLRKLLVENPNCFVSLMHANNEISNLLPIKEVSELCREHDAVFHSDMVQSVCHYKIDLQKIDISMASSSGHKFHAPKGIGFLYINNKYVRINPLLHGGGQERNMRGGTENIAGIAGIAKAFELAHTTLEQDMKYILDVKAYMVSKLLENFPGTEFLGDSMDKGLYTVLSVCFSENIFDEMLLMNLDINGVSASSGSACTSGALKQSHVVHALNVPTNRQVIRFSFSKFNTKEEVDLCISVLKKLRK